MKLFYEKYIKFKKFIKINEFQIKRHSIITNIGSCMFALGIATPAIMPAAAAIPAIISIIRMILCHIRPVLLTQNML